MSGFKDELNDKVWSELASVMGGLGKVIGQGLDAETAAAFKDGIIRQLIVYFCFKL